MMKFLKNPCNLYFLLWTIQIVHAPLNLYGDSISVLVLFFLYAWSLYYFYITITKYNNPPFLKAWNALFILFSIYAIIRMINPFGHVYLGGWQNDRMYLMEHWTSMLPLYPFYVFAKKGDLTRERFVLWVFVFVGTAVVNYYYGKVLLLSLMARLGRYDVEQGTNNMGYTIAMVLPSLYLLRRKPVLQYTGIAIILMFVLLALKRGAILVGFVVILMQVLQSTKRSKGYVKILSVMSMVVLGVVTFYFIQQQMSTNDYFMTRFEQTAEGDVSNRDEHYLFLWNYFLNQMNALQIMFGLGADGCILAFGDAAHNDWLEILISNGLIGISFFAALWIRAFGTYRKMVNRDLKILFSMVIVMLFLRTFFSMSICDMYISSTSILGYCLANMYNETEDLV